MTGNLACGSAVARPCSAPGPGLGLAHRARAAPLGCGTPPCAFGPTTSLAQARKALADILELALLPFWRSARSTPRPLKATT